MAYYRHHVFICCNQRALGEPCCNDFGADRLLAYLKKRVKALGLAGPGQIRVSQSGCLGRCNEGPVMVIYPEAVWYTFIDEADIDDIVAAHLQQGRVVERLQLP